MVGVCGEVIRAMPARKHFFLQEVLPYTFDIIMLVEGDRFQHYRGCNRSKEDETNGNVGRVNMFLHQEFSFFPA